MARGNSERMMESASATAAEESNISSIDFYLLCQYAFAALHIRYGLPHIFLASGDAQQHGAKDLAADLPGGGVGNVGLDALLNGHVSDERGAGGVGAVEYHADEMLARPGGNDGAALPLGEHQTAGRGRLGMGEHLAHIPFLHHHAFIQNGHMAAYILHHAHLMGNDDDSDAQLLVDAADQLQNGVGGGGIQGAGGLVAQQHLGVGGQSTGDGHPLLLPAGELGGVGPGLVRQSHQFQQLFSPPLGLPFPHARQLQREADVAQAVALHQEVEALKDHGHISAHGAQLTLGETAQIAPVHDHASLRGTLQHIDAAHQRALARAAHADDAEDIPVRNGQRHVFQRRDLSLRASEGLG